jgi:hypothetical protein
MVEIKIKTNNDADFKMPLLGYVIAKFFDTAKPFAYFLNKLETKILANKINHSIIDRPIYITGVARAGTTITLTMLSRHPDTATHRYKHMPMPYLPIFFSAFADRTNILVNPIERMHKDTIIVNRESPEALEEIFWQNFFDNIHNEYISQQLDKNTSNNKFENFYRKHIQKLLFSQGGSRYLSKNNYIITRMEYILKILPTAKFLVLIRNPINHISSLIKQTDLFNLLEKKDPLLLDWTRIIGHREFGYHKICINTGNTEMVHNIHELWKNKKTYVKGWAHYWSSIYGFLAERLKNNKKLRKSTLIVKYNDLCENPADTIGRILQHTELSEENYQKIRDYYIRNLCAPSYYESEFTKQELQDIDEVTADIAKKFGL